MYIPIQAVIDFITDENLGPYKISKSDPEAWRLQINEPQSWGTNDKKWRCGIGIKNIDEQKVVVFNGFKAAALYGVEYHGIFFKFVKLVKGFTSIHDAREYFLNKYLTGQDIHLLMGEYKQKDNNNISESKTAVNVPDKFERFDSDIHKDYVDYLHKRGVSEKRIQSAKLFVNAEEQRLVFPVYEDGSLIFYSGRDITNKSPLKWKKSFGDDVHPIWNIDSLSTTAVVFEACFDAIHFNNGIALFGVGTESQFRKLLKLKLNKIILVFDNDKAGRNARLKWAEWLTEHNQQGVYIYDYSGIPVKDFGMMAEQKIPFELKERMKFWDYRAKLLYKMEKII